MYHLFLPCDLPGDVCAGPVSVDMEKEKRKRSMLMSMAAFAAAVLNTDTHRPATKVT